MNLIIKQSSINVIFKFVQFLCTSYYLGLISRQLKISELGLILLFIGIQAFSLSLDFGFGQSLRNKFTEISVRKSTKKNLLSEYLSVTVLVLGVISMILILVAFMPNYSLQNILYYNVIKKYEIQIFLSIKIFLISQIFAVSLTALNLIFFSFQKVVEKAFFDTISPLIIAVILSFYHKGLLPTTLVIFFVPIIVNIVAFIFIINIEKLKISFSNLKLEHIKSLFDKGFYFWLLSISSSLFFATDTLLLTYSLNSSIAAQYAIIQRPVILLLGLHFLVLTPLWSYYTRLFVNGNILEAGNILKKTVFLTLVVLVFGSLFYINFYQIIIKLWFHQNITSQLTVVLICIWAFLYGLMNCFSVFLNGIGEIKYQTYSMLFVSVINIPLSLVLIKYFGINGTIISSLILILIPIVTNFITIKRIYA